MGWVLTTIPGKLVSCCSKTKAVSSSILLAITTGLSPEIWFIKIPSWIIKYLLFSSRDKELNSSCSKSYLTFSSGFNSLYSDSDSLYLSSNTLYTSSADIFNKASSTSAFCLSFKLESFVPLP